MNPSASIRVAVATALLLAAAAAPSAVRQLRVQPVAEQPGEVALRLMLRKLLTVGTFMQTTAHPDDEDNGLLAMLGHGQGMRTVLVSATRGEGGQNEIGPELFDALSVLRTAELESVHRFDGAEQFFTRAIDFGFSFSVEESIEKWGRDEIVGDYVRHIRATRPHVIAAFVCGGAGGGQAHQASTVLTLEAVAAAADPSRYPDQIKEGLRPWQVLRTFCTEGFAVKGPLAADLLTVHDTTFDPLLGRTYGEVGIEARSMHKCQGTSQLLPLPGQSFARTYRLRQDATGRSGPLQTLFDGIDTSVGEVTQFVDLAEAAIDRDGAAAAAPPLASALHAVRARRSQLKSAGLEDMDRYERDFRLEQKERQLEAALMASQGIRLEALADDGVVIAGQQIAVTAFAAARGTADVAIQSVRFSGVESAPIWCSGPVGLATPLKCDATGRVIAPKLTTPYWRASAGNEARYHFEDAPFGVPFEPTPYRATFELMIAGVQLRVERPIEYRYSDVLAGEKRMELQVVTPLDVSLPSSMVVVPRSAAAQSRTVRVTVTNNAKGPSTGAVTLHPLAGWTVRPRAASVRFSREDESTTVAFDVTPPPGIVPGDYQLVMTDASPRTASVGVQVIEYPHIRRRQMVRPAEVRFRVIDATIAPRLRVGYIMGVGDQVSDAIRQLGAAVEMIDAPQLVAGDLSKYDVIVTGVRAYERRPDLRSTNHRLLAYAENGGTVLVQYNKFEFNEAQYGPFPAKVSANRISDEHARVEMLVPTHAVFTRPNRIEASAWSGWVQERGLYFLGERDPRYVDLIRMTDPFPYNAGVKTGALVEAKVGRGRWVYIGLGLWRQLPAGVPGAYRLLANLLSLGARPFRP